MAENRSIHCPNEKDHNGHKKTLLMVGDDYLIAHCKVHGWIKIQLVKHGQPVDLSGCSAIVTEMPKEHIMTEAIPMISVGEFDK